MSEAIAISTTSAVPAASAVQTTGKADAGKGFAAALAALLGGGATASADHSAQPHPQTTKTSARKATPQQSDATGTAIAVPATAVVVPPAQPQTIDAAQIAPAQTPAQTGKAQDIAIAANATVGAAAASAATATTDASSPAQPAASAQPDAATQSAAATQPQTAQAIAQQVLAQQVSAAAGTSSTQAPATTAKVGQKPAPAKHDAAPTNASRNTADAPTQSSGAKAEIATPVAPADQRASDNGAGNGSQLPAAKPDTTTSQLSASATPVVMTVQSAPDIQTVTAPATVAPIAVPLDALAVHIARKFESGESRFEIRLDPIELGKLDISLTVNDDGRVQAVVRAERPETLDMLQRDARLLENQLRQSGLNVDSHSLNFSLGGGNRQAFADNSQPFARTLANTPAIEAPKTTTATVSVRDGVDIRI